MLDRIREKLFDSDKNTQDPVKKFLREWPKYFFGGENTITSIIDLANRLPWQQDKFGNWKITLPSNIFIIDNQKAAYPYEICVPRNSELLDRGQEFNHLLKTSLGLEKPDRLLVRNSHTQGALYGGVAGVHMNGVDVTGIERTTLTTLLIDKGCKIAPPIFSTTNYYAAPYLAGEIPTLFQARYASDLLKDAERKLISERLWEDPSIKIETVASNYRTINSEIWCIDPVYRSIKGYPDTQFAI